MNKAELKGLWTTRLAGLAAVNAVVAAERGAANVDELLLRTGRMFMHGEKRYDKEEQKVRDIWIEWRRRAAAAGPAASRP